MSAGRMFHGTRRDVLPSILHNGLQPRDDAWNCPDGQPVVWLTDTLQMAFQCAWERAELPDDVDGSLGDAYRRALTEDIAVLRVDVEGLDVDGSFNGVVREAIPSHRITVMDAADVFAGLLEEDAA